MTARSALEIALCKWSLGFTAVEIQQHLRGRSWPEPTELQSRTQSFDIWFDLSSFAIGAIRDISGLSDPLLGRYIDEGQVCTEGCVNDIFEVGFGFWSR